MKNQREEWYDADRRVAITIVDVTDAVQALARGHLCGPTSAHFLARACAEAALLGAEMSEKDETVIVQKKCTGPLGGVTVECTAQGTLRGYTEKKTLEAFDGMGAPDEKKVLGDTRLQVTRSVPGRIISQGISNSIDGYLAGSLQRRAVIHTEAAVSDEVEILGARGVMLELLPDSRETLSVAIEKIRLSVSSRKILEQLGFPGAELKKSVPLSFACRCSPERAVAMLSALSAAERASLPEAIDITCHMCGRTFTVHPSDLK